jgi:ferredoxin/flavodoxin---NADP+ reductase
VVGTGERVTIAAEMVLRSVGYRGVALPGVPFDEATGTIPNTGGRVLRDGRPSPGEYAAGWIKRGPTGVIGSNRSDASETVRSLLDDASAGLLPRRGGDADPEAFLDLLDRCGVRVVPWTGWLAIDEAEVHLGVADGRRRVKLADREALLAAASVSGDGPGSRPPRR